MNELLAKLLAEFDREQKRHKERHGDQWYTRHPMNNETGLKVFITHATANEIRKLLENQ